MALDCPQTITRDGVTCELFDRFTASDFGGLLKTEVCSYRCEDGKYYSRWINRIGCLRGRVHSHVFTPSAATPASGPDCPQTVTLEGGVVCELFDKFFEPDFYGLLRLELCVYKCNDGTFYSHWINRICCFAGSSHSHRTRPEPD
jgi:hypothetical protein